MESEIRAAIAADPTDPAPRRALAEFWGPGPAAELVGLLLGKPSHTSSNAIRRWFEAHVGWPTWPNGEKTDHFRFAPMYTCNGWLQGAFDPANWPDQGRWHAGVVALARRRLVNAREWSAWDDRFRGPLAKLTTTAAWTPPGPDAAASAPAPGHFTLEHTVAIHTIHAAQTVAAIMYDDPGSDPGSGSMFEEEQFHVLGWAWLGLPPLRPESPSEGPWYEVGPSAGTRPARFTWPRGVERFVQRWVVRWFRR